MTRWKCNKCPYVYDPRVGDPDGGIPPGTPFERIPDDWVCPVCGASKRDFRPLAAPPAASPAVERPTTAPASSSSSSSAGAPAPVSVPVAETRPRLSLTVGSLRGKPQL